MRFAIKFAALLPILVSTNTSAETVVFQRPNVVVLESEQFGCGMVLRSQVVDRGSADLIVNYDAKAKEVQFSLSSEVTTSLPDTGTKNLELVFVNDGEYDDGWGVREFTFYKNENQWTFMRYFKGGNASIILEDIAKSTYVALVHNDDLFTGGKLENTAMAIKALRKCAFDAAGLNENDPFAR